MSKNIRQGLALTGDDFARALHELVETGRELTRNYLGFPARSGA
jgi:hypothetical protein